MTRRDEILLKEYETCQSHNNALGNQSWISISILITVNLLLLGQVIYNLVLTSFPINGHAKLILITVLGLVMIFILLIFQRWDKRVDFQIRLNNERMRNIEEDLDFEIWKNWRVRGLDLYYSKEKHGLTRRYLFSYP